MVIGLNPPRRTPISYAGDIDRVEYLGKSWSRVSLLASSLDDHHQGTQTRQRQLFATCKPELRRGGKKENKIELIQDICLWLSKVTNRSSERGSIQFINWVSNYRFCMIWDVTESICHIHIHIHDPSCLVSELIDFVLLSRSSPPKSSANNSK